MTCDPDIQQATVAADWDFLLLACDGQLPASNSCYLSVCLSVCLSVLYLLSVLCLYVLYLLSVRYLSSLPGIWDVLSNQEVVDFVTQRLGQGMEPEDICEQLMTRSPLASC